MAVQVSAGVGHSLALLENGKVYSWGNNTQGCAGWGPDNLICSNDPNLIIFQTDFKQIAAGMAHSCAITTSDRLVVWGTNR